MKDKNYILREFEIKYKNTKKVTSVKFQSSQSVFDWFKDLSNDADRKSVV